MLIAGTDSDNGSGFWRYQTFAGDRWSAAQDMPRLASRRGGTRWYGGYFEPNCFSKSLCTAVMGGNFHYYGAGGSGGWLVTFSATTSIPGRPAQSWMPRNTGKSHWSAPVQATSGSHLYSSVCFRASKCITTDDQRNTVGVFQHHKISGERKQNKFKYDASYISCARSTLCLATSDIWDTNNANRLWNGSAWKAIPTLDNAQCNWSAGCYAFSITYHKLTNQSSSQYSTFSRVLAGRAVPQSVMAFDTDDLGFGDSIPKMTCVGTRFCLALGQDHTYVMGSGS